MRERAARERENEQSEVMGVDISSNVEKSVLKENEDTLSVDSINIDREKRRKESIDVEMRQDDMVESPKHVRRDSTSSTSDDSTSLSSDDYSSSSSSDKSDHIIDNKRHQLHDQSFYQSHNVGLLPILIYSRRNLMRLRNLNVPKHKSVPLSHVHSWLR